MIYLSTFNRTFFSMDRRGLQATTCLFTFYTAVVRFLSLAFDRPAQSRRETVRRTRGHRAIIVRSSQRYREIARISYDARAASSQRSQGDLTVAVRQPYDSLTGVLRLSLDLTVIVRYFRFKWPSQILRSPHDCRKATVRPPCRSRAGLVRASCDVPTTCLRATILSFLFFCIIPS